MAIIGCGIGVEAKRALGENVCKEGRKYGGCAILWKLNVKRKADSVEFKSNRFLFT